MNKLINQLETDFSKVTEVKSKIEKEKNLILYNDDVNTFDHVIDCLIKYCNHNPIQAEQCAYIVHFNGKCIIKSGLQKELLPIKENLQDKGLTVSIQ